MTVNATTALLASSGLQVIALMGGNGMVDLTIGNNGAGSLNQLVVQGCVDGDIALESNWTTLSGRDWLPGQGNPFISDAWVGWTRQPAIKDRNLDLHNLPAGQTAIININASTFRWIRVLASAATDTQILPRCVRAPLRAELVQGLYRPIVAPQLSGSGNQQFPVNPVTHWCGGYATMLPTGGTVSAAGILTTNDGPAQMLPSVCWIWLPAGAVVGGGAGLYLATPMTRLTYQVYSNYIVNAESSATLFPPGGRTNAVGSGAPYVVPGGVNISLAAHYIPGALIGAYGGLELEIMVSGSLSTNNKVVQSALSGTGSPVPIGYVGLAPTFLSGRYRWQIYNRGVHNRQITVASNGCDGGSTNAPTYGGIDTVQGSMVRTTIQMTGADANVAWLVLESSRLTLLQSGAG
jgi:hypothetical protein